MGPEGGAKGQYDFWEAVPLENSQSVSGDLPQYTGHVLARDPELTEAGGKTAVLRPCWGCSLSFSRSLMEEIINNNNKNSYM